jgi:hypothetical protein
LSFAKTPHEAILVHVTCYAVSLYVIDFTCALDFGEAHRSLDHPASNLVKGTACGQKRGSLRLEIIDPDRVGVPSRVGTEFECHPLRHCTSQD